jgi:hypothetical protein
MSADPLSELNSHRITSLHEVLNNSPGITSLEIKAGWVS